MPREFSRCVFGSVFRLTHYQIADDEEFDQLCSFLKTQSINQTINQFDLRGLGLRPEQLARLFKTLNSYQTINLLDLSSISGFKSTTFDEISAIQLKNLLTSHQSIYRPSTQSKNQSVNQSFGQLNLCYIGASSLQECLIAQVWSCCSLQSINLSNNQMGSKLCASICRALIAHPPHQRTITQSIRNSISQSNQTSNQTLTSLNLESNNLDESSDCAQLINQLIQSINSLTHINLSRNNFGPDFQSKLYQTINQSTCCLQSINLDSNTQLADCGSINQLISALTINTSLITISLSNCGIRSLDSVGQAIKHNSSLTSINLSNNQFDSDQVINLLDNLASNDGLIHLNLSSNRLIDPIAPSFCRLIAISPSLESINLSNNHLTDAFIFPVLHTVRSSESCALSTINLSINSINQRFIARLNSFVQANSHRQQSKLIDHYNQLIDSMKDTPAKICLIDDEIASVNQAINRALIEEQNQLERAALQRQETVKQTEIRQSILSSKQSEKRELVEAAAVRLSALTDQSINQTNNLKSSAALKRQEIVSEKKLQLQSINQLKRTEAMLTSLNEVKAQGDEMMESINESISEVEGQISEVQNNLNEHSQCSIDCANELIARYSLALHAFSMTPMHHTVHQSNNQASVFPADQIELEASLAHLRIDDDKTNNPSSDPLIIELCPPFHNPINPSTNQSINLDESAAMIATRVDLAAFVRWFAPENARPDFIGQCKMACTRQLPIVMYALATLQMAIKQTKDHSTDQSIRQALNPADQSVEAPVSSLDEPLSDQAEQPFPIPIRFVSLNHIHHSTNQSNLNHRQLGFVSIPLRQPIYKSITPPPESEQSISTTDELVANQPDPSSTANETGDQAVPTSVPSVNQSIPAQSLLSWAPLLASVSPYSFVVVHRINRTVNQYINQSISQTATANDPFDPFDDDISATLLTNECLLIRSRLNDATPLIDHQFIKSIDCLIDSTDQSSAHDFRGAIISAFQSEYPSINQSISCVINQFSLSIIPSVRLWRDPSHYLRGSPATPRLSLEEAMMTLQAIKPITKQSNKKHHHVAQPIKQPVLEPIEHPIPAPNQSYDWAAIGSRPTSSGGGRSVSRSIRTPDSISRSMHLGATTPSSLSLSSGPSRPMSPLRSRRKEHTHPSNNQASKQHPSLPPVSRPVRSDSTQPANHKRHAKTVASKAKERRNSVVSLPDKSSIHSTSALKTDVRNRDSPASKATESLNRANNQPKSPVNKRRSIVVSQTSSPVVSQAFLQKRRASIAMSDKRRGSLVNRRSSLADLSDDEPDFETKMEITRMPADFTSSSWQTDRSTLRSISQTFSLNTPVIPTSDPVTNPLNELELDWDCIDDQINKFQQSVNQPFMVDRSIHVEWKSSQLSLDDSLLSCIRSWPRLHSYVINSTTCEPDEDTKYVIYF